MEKLSTSVIKGNWGKYIIYFSSINAGRFAPCTLIQNVVEAKIMMYWNLVSIFEIDILYPGVPARLINCEYEFTWTMKEQTLLINVCLYPTIHSCKKNTAKSTYKSNRLKILFIHQLIDYTSTAIVCKIILLQQFDCFCLTLGHTINKQNIWLKSKIYYLLFSTMLFYVYGWHRMPRF